MATERPTQTVCAPAEMSKKDDVSEMSSYVNDVQSVIDGVSWSVSTHQFDVCQ